ncbi:MAG: glycosyltransferase family 39 protein [Acidimicrobiia bacterium]
MSTVRDAPPVASPAEGRVPRSAAIWLVVAVGVAIAAGVVLRFVTRSELWLDEALTVNVASLPIDEISDALRQDGAPPLYYVLLHGWMEVFGTGNFAVRALSGVFGVLTIPAMWFAGRRLGGRHADERVRQVVATTAVVLFATSPFAIRYATETRMYALVMLLVVVGYLALCRALECPSLLRLALVAVIAAALAYTQYWSLYLMAVVAVGLAVYAWRSHGDERRAALGCLVAFVAAAIAFLPWLDNFLYQARNTGTPWGEPVLPPATFSWSIEDFGGGDHWESELLRLPLIVLPLLALVGVAIDRWRIELDLRTRPGVRLVAFASIAALWLGATASWLAPEGTFESRYASVVFPLFVLTAAFGFLCFADPRIRTGLLVGMAVLGLTAGVQRNALDQRTQAEQIANSILADFQPGDVVVYCPDQLGPGVARLLDAEDVLQITYPDGGSPEFVNWVDYIERNDVADPNAVARSAIDEAGEDGSIWLVSATHYRGTEDKCGPLGSAIQGQLPVAEGRVRPDDEFFEFGGLVRFSAE